VRINRFVALATGLSRRAADKTISSGLITINGERAILGQEVDQNSDVRLASKKISLPQIELIMLNKPTGYVVSRDGQGSQTIYSLLPNKLSNLKPVGRLDKESSGLLLLTNDGQLAQSLTHPKYQKTKIYHIELQKNLSDSDRRSIEKGVKLSDGLSRLQLSGELTSWTVIMSEGRNRQIRRTFKELGCEVASLHRTTFGSFELKDLKSGHYVKLPASVIL
jgi:23S rRNA pseudouridine2605 synthase